MAQKVQVFILSAINILIIKRTNIKYDQKTVLVLSRSVSVQTTLVAEVHLAEAQCLLEKPLGSW
jgi:hypothetical protein